MKCTRWLGRLGLAVVGFGVGGAALSVPGIAAADNSYDWLTAVDTLLGGGPLSAADATPALNLAISFDGITLFQSGSAQAETATGGGNIAIANGADSTAIAYGSGDYAYVDGTGSTAISGGDTALHGAGSASNTAFVFGDDSYGYAGGINAAHAGTFNYSIIFGDGNTGLAGGSLAGAGNYDGVYIEGDNLGKATAQGGDYLFNVLKFYGDGPDSMASTAASTNSLADLLSTSDPSGALADGNAFWADLFSGDTAGALASGQDFWADLASYFDPSGALADSTAAWTDLLSGFDGAGVAADASNVWTDLVALFQ